MPGSATPRKIVILGGGTGGTLTANRLRRMYQHLDRTDQSVSIVVVDQDNDHLYQPGLLFVPFDLADPAEIVRPRERQLLDGVTFVEAAIDRVDVARQTVVLEHGEALDYDVLVIATGATLALDETEGLTGPGWNKNVFTFYDHAGAVELRDALEHFTRGRIVVNIVDLPIKCPVAPLEFCFLADWFFEGRGHRDDIEIVYATPLDGAFTKPIASAKLTELLDDKGIELVTEFNTGEVRSTGGGPGVLVGYDGREVPFDLAVVIPLHSGAAYVGRSEGLGDELNFVPTDPHTLQSRVSPNIFVIGDAANVPASKAGSVTHFEGEVLTENIARFLDGENLDACYDGHANCFIETGFGKALLIDFNYETEPMAGHFPAAVGLPLLKESRLNHLGKLMFQSIYWHGLLPGRDLPMVGAAMPSRGKRSPDAPSTPPTRPEETRS
jgi:sulfide:quinone oxidoreductase